MRAARSNAVAGAPANAVTNAPSPTEAGVSQEIADNFLLERRPLCKTEYMSERMKQRPELGAELQALLWGAQNGMGAIASAARGYLLEAGGSRFMFGLCVRLPTAHPVSTPWAVLTGPRCGTTGVRVAAAADPSRRERPRAAPPRLARRAARAVLGYDLCEGSSPLSLGRLDGKARARVAAETARKRCAATARSACGDTWRDPLRWPVAAASVVIGCFSVSLGLVNMFARDWDYLTYFNLAMDAAIAASVYVILRRVDKVLAGAAV